MKRRAAPTSLVERIARDRKAPAGMFRLLVLDPWDPPPNHTVVGDYGTIGSARAEGNRWTADEGALEFTIYDDQGRLCWCR